MLKNSRGVSITELVVAMVIMVMTVAAGVQSFRLITTSIRLSRSKTIAINLAQEKMEVLKNMSYFQLQVTTESFTPANYTDVSMDQISYTSETIGLWGMPPFTRGVYVAYAQNFGTPPVVSTVAFTSIDPGMKEVFVYVLYSDGTQYKTVSISSLFANPNASTLDSSIYGMVCISPSVNGGSLHCNAMGGLDHAYVSVLGNPDWAAYTDSNGYYSFQVANGTYTVTVSSSGYFSQDTPGLIVYRSQSVETDYSLTAMSSGTVFTTAWFSPQLVISQVVASSGTQGGVTVQYVELYNPTTFTWHMNGTDFELAYCKNQATCPTSAGFTWPTFNFHQPDFPSHTYYLLASTSPVNVAGVQKDADAEWSGMTIAANDDGGIFIDATFTPPPVPFDAVAWHNTSGAGAAPTLMTEGTAIQLAGGLGADVQIARQTSTGTIRATPSGSYFAAVYGNAYDTDKNSANFMERGPIALQPHNHLDTLVPVSGRPAHQALARSNDLLRASTQAVAYNVGTSTEYALITLVNVATGSWSVDLASNTVGNWNFGSYFLRTTGVNLWSTMTAVGVATGIANGETNPTWLAERMPVSILTSTSSDGWVQGYVYGSGTAYYTPLSNILVNANGTQGYTNTYGYYFLNVSTGLYTVTANFNYHNSNYNTLEQSGSVAKDQIINIGDFHLAQQGIIKGYVTSGTGALPNTTVQAKFGDIIYPSISDFTGYFYINVATSPTAYQVTGVLDAGQLGVGTPTDPLSTTVSVPGATVFAGTITVTGALGYISGTVKTTAGAVLTTGVLIIASGGSIADPPPAIYAATAAALGSPYYAGSSAADGTYSLAVRGGSYNMSAYYPIVDPFSGSVTYSRKTKSGLSVTAGQTLGGQAFTW